MKFRYINLISRSTIHSSEGTALLPTSQAITNHLALSKCMTAALTHGVPCPQCLLLAIATAALQLGPRYLWLEEETAATKCLTLWRCVTPAPTFGAEHPHAQRRVLSRLAHVELCVHGVTEQPTTSLFLSLLCDRFWVRRECHEICIMELFKFSSFWYSMVYYFNIPWCVNLTRSADVLIW